MARMIALRMIDAGGCPFLDEGDRMVLEGMEVLKRRSGRICARAFACILAGDDTELTEGAEFTCSGPGGCRGRFRVEDAGRDESTGAYRLRRDAASTTTDTPFLSRIPVEIVKVLIGRSEILRYDETTVIIREGEVGKSFYIVGDGAAEVVKEGDDSDVVLASLGKGSCFGEMSLLTGEPTSATVRTAGAAAIFAVSGDVLEDILAEQPVLAREFSKLLASRLKATSGSLERELDRGILGRLSMISAVDLIQTLNASRRTGTLTLTYGDRECRLCFSGGEVRGAVMGDLVGEEAFYPVLEWADGDFCFEQSESLADIPGPLTSTTTALLMEGMRRMDESSREVPSEGGDLGDADDAIGEALR